jgi:hypothetical protein
MRALSAVPIAIAMCAAAPAFADVQSLVQAAKKAERRGEWKKALEAWKAAYAADANAEYLIGIGDACAKLGKPDEAKKNYNAYLADPLALPTNVEKVKTKIAALENTGGGLTLPGAALALPGGGEPPPLPAPGLDLPGTAPALAEGGRKGKPKKLSDAPLALPGLDVPDKAPVQVASAEKKPEPGPALALPGLDLPGTTPAASAKKEPDKAAVAANTPPITRSGGSTNGKQVAMATPPTGKPADQHRVPEAAIAAPPVPRQQAEASSTNKVVGFVAAGVALASLGGGALALSKASSAHSSLTGSVHDGATAQSLLENEAKNRTLSFVGFAGGLVAAGIATALFAF